MANHQSLPQHGKPSPTLSLMLKEFTEKNLRRHPEATLRLPTGYPQATPRLPRGYPEATLGGEGGECVTLAGNKGRFAQRAHLGTATSRRLGLPLRLWRRGAGGGGPIQIRRTHILSSDT